MKNYTGIALAALKPEGSIAIATGTALLEKNRAEKLKQQNYRGYLYTFSSEEILKPFLSICRLLADAEYWQLTREVWMCAELIEPDKRTWLRLLQSKKPQRESLMTSEEHAALAAMPDEIQIWRGCGHSAGVHGMCWTIEKSRAEFFASYAIDSRRKVFIGLNNNTTPIVASATCRRADVLAYFTGRGESEIVLNPKHLKAVKFEAASVK